jgi:transposase
MNTLVTDELWNTLAPLLPEHPSSPKGGRARLADRLCLNGILFVLREGIRWQSLPTQLGWGSGSTCYRRFTEWTQAGVWAKGHVSLVTGLADHGLLNLDRGVVDSASVVPCAAANTPGPTQRIGPKKAANAI